MSFSFRPYALEVKKTLSKDIMVFKNMPSGLAMTVCLAVGLLLTPHLSADDTEVEIVSFNEMIDSFNPLSNGVSVDGVRQSVSLQIQFDLGKATIKKESLEQLRILAEAMLSQELGSYRFDLVGHTDASGPEDANMILSERRAISVREYLIKNGNVHPSRLNTAGKGESVLLDKLAPNDKRHRRVEIVAVPLNQNEVGAVSKPDLNIGNTDSGYQTINW